MEKIWQTISSTVQTVEWLLWLYVTYVKIKNATEILFVLPMYGTYNLKAF